MMENEYSQISTAVPQGAPMPPVSQRGSYGNSGYRPAPRKRRWWIAVLVVAVIAVIGIGMYSCAASFNRLDGASTPHTSNTVSIIDINGTIGYDGTANSPEGLKKLLDQAESDPGIKAVVLRVNSGGGTSTAGEEMANYVREFSKPIVVSSASMNASAAYMISSQAKRIYVAQTTEIGAIGVDLTVTDLSGLLEKLGIDVDNITSAASKDSSYGTRPLTDAERAYYQNMVNQINEVFIKTVADGRGMSVDSVRALATGMPFTGNDSVANGLSDQVGTLEDACAGAADMAGCGSTYHTDTLSLPKSDLSSLLGLLSSSSSNTTTVDQLAAAIKELQGNEATVR